MIYVICGVGSGEFIDIASVLRLRGLRVLG